VLADRRGAAGVIGAGRVPGRLPRRGLMGSPPGWRKNSQRSRKTGSFGEEDLDSLPLSDALRSNDGWSAGPRRPKFGPIRLCSKALVPSRRHLPSALFCGFEAGNRDLPPVIPIPRVSASRGAGRGNDRGPDRSAVAGAHAISPHRQGTPWRRRVRGGALLLMVPYLVVVGGTQPRIHADCTMENDEPPLLL
jgi:hypothetical protein